MLLVGFIKRIYIYIGKASKIQENIVSLEWCFFYCCFFNDAVSNRKYTASNGAIFSE